MEIFRAWFVWGESDLFFPGVILLLIFVLLPWREGETGHVTGKAPVSALKVVLTLLAVSAAVGGIALAITYGRVICCVWEWKPGFRR